MTAQEPTYAQKYERLEKVIESCKTQEQFDNAVKYVSLYIKGDLLLLDSITIVLKIQAIKLGFRLPAHHIAAATRREKC